MPNFTSANNLVLLVTFVFFYIGIEMTAAHVNNLKRPSRDYPIAILIVSVVMAVISISGALILAWLVPAKDMLLNAGIMQAFDVIFGSNSSWIVTIVGLLIVIGAVGEVIAWVLGPVRGLSVTARHGTLPPLLQKTNKVGIPVGLLIAQAILVTFWGIVFLAWPGDLNASFWALFALTTTVYIVMYFLMYLAVIKLRYSQPNTVRKFQIPGGNWVFGSSPAGASSRWSASSLSPCCRPHRWPKIRPCSRSSWSLGPCWSRRYRWSSISSADHPGSRFRLQKMRPCQPRHRRAAPHLRPAGGSRSRVTDEQSPLPTNIESSPTCPTCP